MQTWKRRGIGDWFCVYEMGKGHSNGGYFPKQRVLFEITEIVSDGVCQKVGGKMELYLAMKTRTGDDQA